MFKWLRKRAESPELMDDFSMGGSELHEALQHLRWLNRIFGAAAPTLYGIQRLWEEAGKPKRMDVLDVGAGSGDVNRHLLRWADRMEIDLNIILVDVTEEACAEARRLFRNEPRIEVMQSHLFEIPENEVDVVTGTQFIHHFSDHDLPSVVKSMMNASRFGVVINDIHRHWLPWVAVWLTVRLMSRNRYILHDGPLSVAKGFRAEDWDNLRKKLSTDKMMYAWRPLFRYVVIIGKSNGVI